MSETLIWFVAFCVILGLEMILSTVYLLTLAAGALTAALLSLAGSALSVHVTCASFVTVVAASAVFFWKKKHPKDDKGNDDTLHPDIGREVIVGKCESGFARVSYRGTTWNARAEEGELSSGIWKIASIDGTSLVLTPKTKDGNHKKS